MKGVLLGALTAMAVALAGTPLLVRVLRAKGIGQPIQDEVTHHAAKAGTPTMGGLVIPVAVVAGYAMAMTVLPGGPRRNAVAVVAAVIGASLTGTVDDWLKVRRGRNLGLREAQKTVMLLLVAVGFALVYVTGSNPCTRVSVTRCTNLPVHPGRLLWAVGAVGVFWLTSNSVNFADGIEGLLAGSATTTFTGLALVAFWQFRHPAVYPIDGALQLAVIAAALAAACAGLLWWNGDPGVIFMGDAGSLAIGAGIVTLMLSMQVALLLPVIGCVYVAEGASSFLQRYYFRLTGGRRLFRMAPLHHHFEMLGWSEPTIITRLWIVSALGAAIAVGVFYGDALHLL